MIVRLKMTINFNLFLILFFTLKLEAFVFVCNTMIAIIKVKVFYC